MIILKQEGVAIWTRLKRYEGARLTLEGDAGLNWESVKLLKNWGDVVNGGSFRDNMSGRILNRIKFME